MCIVQEIRLHMWIRVGIMHWQYRCILLGHPSTSNKEKQRIRRHLKGKKKINQKKNRSKDHSKNKTKKKVKNKRR